MSKKIVCIGVALLMCLGLFSACGKNDDEIDFAIGYQGVGFGQDRKSVIKTFEEWDVLRPDHAMITELDKYNEAFFANKALILYTFGASGDYAPEFSVKKLVLTNGTLTINLTQDEMTSGLAYFSITILIEISQKDVSNVANIETNVTIK